MRVCVQTCLCGSANGARLSSSLSLTHAGGHVTAAEPPATHVLGQLTKVDLPETWASAISRRRHGERHSQSRSLPQRRDSLRAPCRREPLASKPRPRGDDTAGPAAGTGFPDVPETPGAMCRAVTTTEAPGARHALRNTKGRGEALRCDDSHCGANNPKTKASCHVQTPAGTRPRGRGSHPGDRSFVQAPT